MIDLLIISGASKGIGANILKTIQPDCKHIIAISSSGNIENYSNAYNLKLDISDYKNTENKVKEQLLKLSNINSIGIVLCAAQLGEPGGLLNTDLNSWEKLYNCNVLGNLAIVKACGDLIKNNIKTRIVFFGGGGGAYPNLEFSSYGITKAAIIRQAETLSVEFKNYNTSVIALAPGAVSTDMLSKVIKYGGYIKTTTDIMEPTNFVINFINDNLPNFKELNGKFLHVRDDLNNIDFSNKDILTLRRNQ